MKIVVILNKNSCHFVNLINFTYSIFLFTVWDKSRYPGANWCKLEHMKTTLGILHCKYITLSHLKKKKNSTKKGLLMHWLSKGYWSFTTKKDCFYRRSKATSTVEESAAFFPPFCRALGGEPVLGNCSSPTLSRTKNCPKVLKLVSKVCPI